MRRCRTRSRAVIKPTSLPSLVTSGSFLIFRWTMMRSASSGSTGPSCTTRCARGVMRSTTRDFSPLTNRMSRSVRSPVSRPLSSTTTSVPTRVRSIKAAASSSDASGRMLQGSRMTPCCVRFTFSTSRTCGSISPARKPRSMIPIPPSSACTMAIGARVTVSMFAETIGRLSVIRRDRREDRSIAVGSRRRSTLRCGDRMKSSNVQPRTSSRVCRPTVLSIRGNADITSYYRHTGTAVPLREIETALRKRLGKTLPGIDAQMRFAPDLLRKAWRTGQFPAQSRQAAALLLLYPHETGAAVALTVRASGLARHPGQISLPGGATDPGETLAQAALREAAEETGVDPQAVRIRGELTPVHVIVSGFTLRPVVGVTDRRPDFVAAPDEVEEILEVSLEHLRDASRIRQGTRIREGVAVEYPYFDLLGHQVWGATAMVLGEFICLLAEIEQ